MNGSASATERTLACPASLALPKVHRSSAYAERGHGIHAFVRAVLAGVPHAAAVAAVDEEHLGTCNRMQVSALVGDLYNVRCEVAYALDPIARTARFLGVDVGRNYEQFNLGPNEIPGSLDIEGTNFTDVPVVRDLKTGYLDVTDAEDNGQGLFFAAVKYLMTGAPEVIFEILKLRPDGSLVTVSSATYTAFELDSFLDSLEEALVESRAARRVYLAGGTPDVTVGTWCRFCESMESCPAYMRLAKSMASDVADIETRVDHLTLPEAGVAWRKAKTIEAMLKRVLEALKSRARQEPLPIDGGKQVKAISFGRSDFDRDLALAMLRERGATDAEIAVLFRESEVEQIREVNDPNAARQPKARKRAKKVKPLDADETERVRALIDTAWEREADIKLNAGESS